MALREQLVFKGYLPENLPPAFSTSDIADFIADNPGPDWWNKKSTRVRPASYNASKRGITRRVFSLAHPITMRDMAKFVDQRWDPISAFLARIDTSLSVPKALDDGDRALAIATHAELEAATVTRLSRYRFIAKTDISRFYHS